MAFSTRAIYAPLLTSARGVFVFVVVGAGVVFVVVRVVVFAPFAASLARSALRCARRSRSVIPLRSLRARAAAILAARSAQNAAFGAVWRRGVFVFACVCVRRGCVTVRGSASVCVTG